MRDVRSRRQLRRQEALIIVPIRGDDLQEEIGLSGEHMRLAHLGPGSDQRLEGFEIGLGLSRKPNLGEDRDAEAERFRIDLGMVAADIARLFQGADAPQAWWRRDSGSLGEVNVSHTAI